MSRVAVYKRVSTDSQDTAMQDHAIQQWLTQRGITEVVQFQDVGVSGKTDRRAGYQALCAAVERGEIDSVVVYRLDRLSRHAITALQLLLNWMQRGVEFFAVDQPVLQLGKDNPMRLTVVAMFSELAQLEREAIVARVKTGLAAAKARGVKLGAESKLTSQQREQIRELRQRGITYREVAKRMQVSKTTVIRVCSE